MALNLAPYGRCAMKPSSVGDFKRWLHQAS